MDPPYSLNNTHRYEIVDPQTGQRLPVTKIFDSDGNINYVTISGSNTITINYLYHVLLEFSARHPLLLPEMLLPQYVPEKGFLIPAKCFIDKPLAEFDKSWFFETISLYDKTTNSYQQKTLYFTTQFKCLFYSITKQLLLSVDEITKLQEMFPVIDLNQMYVSPANGIIFTKYQKKKKDGEYGFHSVITDLIALVDTIFEEHGDNSQTLSIEIEDLKEYLRNAKNSEDVLNNILGQMVFWNRHMRIDYIFQLMEHVNSNDILSQGQANRVVIFDESGSAFVSVDGHNDWVKTLKNYKNPILSEAFHSGNSFIDINFGKLTKHRTYKITGESDYFKFFSGLTRFRDMYMHINEYNIFDEQQRIVTDLHIQAILQDLFPKHMVELKKSLKYVSGFNVKVLVMSVLGLSQDEA